MNCNGACSGWTADGAVQNYDCPHCRECVDHVSLTGKAQGATDKGDWQGRGGSRKRQADPASTLLHPGEGASWPLATPAARRHPEMKKAWVRPADVNKSVNWRAGMKAYEVMDEMGEIH